MSFNGRRTIPTPINEPINSYAPGTPARAELKARLASMAGERVDIPMFIGGREIRTGAVDHAVMPHAHRHVLADYHKATADDVDQAIAASLAARHEWASWPWEERAAVFLKAADLAATTWRSTLNAATMLGQSKTAFQSEIDAACEVIDFWRFNPSSAQTDLRGAADLRQGDVEPARLPRPRRLRLRDHAVQLHRHRRQPADGAGADGLLGRVEAGLVGDAERLLPLSPARRGRAAAGRHQHGLGRRGDDLRAAARPSRAGGRALHRQHDGLQLDVEDHRRLDEQLPQLSAHRRRDRRQGLHRRARVGRRGPGGRGDRARGLRVSGPEVLGGQPRLRAQGDVAGAAGSRGRDDRRDPDGRRARLPQLHGRGDRPQGLRSHHRLHRARARQRDDRRRRHVGRHATATSSRRRSSRPPTRRTSCCRKRSSARS